MKRTWSFCCWIMRVFFDLCSLVVMEGCWKEALVSHRDPLYSKGYELLGRVRAIPNWKSQYMQRRYAYCEFSGSECDGPCAWYAQSLCTAMLVNFDQEFRNGPSSVCRESLSLRSANGDRVCKPA
ncbi:hypothetical protein BDV96DRAFT_373163 [Lophiotrema nucula]|uniref:Uncharacterized protein n=1 Tax=Lophiotrema nucula TaxID=690887 RepID=A0A6A5YDY0_9PLEO|nr:hypothetical protein BDV96DRAFT_373163 [Lophiotrema nucula]